jgi:hypothetical protein
VHATAASRRRASPANVGAVVVRPARPMTGTVRTTACRGNGGPLAPAAAAKAAGLLPRKRSGAMALPKSIDPTDPDLPAVRSHR